MLGAEDEVCLGGDDAPGRRLLPKVAHRLLPRRQACHKVQMDDRELPRLPDLLCHLREADNVKAKEKDDADLTRKALLQCLLVPDRRDDRAVLHLLQKGPIHSRASSFSAVFASSSRIGRCCGHCLSHCPHRMQSDAFASWVFQA